MRGPPARSVRGEHIPRSTGAGSHADTRSYMTAVAAALGGAGFCPHVDPEGEIGVKEDNSRNEQWIIASRAGWNPPSANWVQRKYVGACSPATF